MINLDTIIKISRQRGHKEDWPIQTRYILQRLETIKLGFPGIRNDHLSFITFDKIQEGDIFIYDLYLEGGTGDEAPLMLKKLGEEDYFIEGIGCGVDSKRDPDRVMRWRDTIKLRIPPEILVCRVDVRPTLNGGPGYYYFFRSYRDSRL